MVTNRKTTLSDVMKALKDEPEISKARSEIKLIKKIIDDILSIPVERRSSRLHINDFDESLAIRDAAVLISSETGETNTKISVFDEDMEDVKAHDPQSRARFSRPFKPAIYLV